MPIEQISIFLENRAGQLARALQLIADNNINILASSLADTSDFGILRILVDNTGKAVTCLLDNNFTIGKTTVIAIEINNTPGGLSQVVSLLATQSINVEYMYSCVCPDKDKAIIIFRFDRTDEALKILNDFGILLPKLPV